MAVPFYAFLFCSLIVITNNLKVIPERAVIEYLNNKYLAFGNVTVTRYGRRSNYYLNVEGENLQEWNNNVSLHLIFFEFLHNEYRRSFVEMHFNKICNDLVDPYVGQLLKNAGFECPLLPGVHRYMNLTVPVEDFPGVWPFQKCRVDVTILASNRIIIGNGSIYFTFLNELKKKKRLK